MKKYWLVGIFFLCTLSAFAGPNDKLHLYNWNNYLAPETIQNFEATCQCTVVQTYYSDNEEMLAKLAAGAKGYDVIVPTGNAVETLIKQKALQTLDKTRISHWNNLSKKYINPPFDPGNQYSIPYAYTTTVLGYNDEKIRALGINPHSWAAIFDPRILEKIKGRVTVLDSANELMAAALKYLGYSANDTDPQHWQEAKAVILKAKPYWAAFNASSYIKELVVGNIWLAHGYSNDIFQAHRDAQKVNRAFHIKAAVPDEGFVLSLDSLVIPQSAPRPDLAYKFINFILTGENSAQLSNLIGAGNPNTAALTFIRPDLTQRPEVFPNDAILAKAEQLKDLSRTQRRLLNRLWTEIRAH